MIAFSSEREISISKPVTYYKVLSFKLLRCRQESVNVLPQAHLKRSANPCRDIGGEHGVWDSREACDPFELVKLRIFSHHRLHFLQQALFESWNHASATGQNQVLDNSSTVLVM